MNRMLKPGLALLLMATTAAATGGEGVITKSGWYVGGADGHCGMTMTYEGQGETELLLTDTEDGGIAVSLKNIGWSATKGNQYALRWVLDDVSYSGDAAGLGERYESKKGFVGKFEADFIDHFATSSGLSVHLNDTLVDNLSLAGSSEAVALFRKCLAKEAGKREAEARERARWSHLPKDPFAEPAAPTEEPTEKEPVP